MTDFKDTDVSDDHLFLQELLEKHNINAKQLADLTGRARSTIYKYLSGEATIPSIVWRSIYTLTLDPSIRLLFTGDIPCLFASLLNFKPAPNAATMQKLIETRRSQLKCEEYVLGIIADGRIDKSDAAMIAKYKTEFSGMVENVVQVYHAVINQYEKALAEATQ